MGVLLIAVGIGTILVSGDVSAHLFLQMLTAVVGLGMTGWGLRIELNYMDGWD